MTSNNDEQKILPRSFIARIAEHLAKITDQRVALRSEWRLPIEKNPVANTLNVPLDAELVVPLVPRRANLEDLDPREIDQEALCFCYRAGHFEQGPSFPSEVRSKGSPRSAY